MIDLEKPMHFSKEQSEWIKAYVILKKKEARADTINECIDAISDCWSPMECIDVLTELKEKQNF